MQIGLRRRYRLVPQPRLRMSSFLASALDSRRRFSPGGREDCPPREMDCLPELVCLEVLAPVVTDDGDEEVRPSRLRARLAAVKVGPYEMARADERSIWRE